MFCAFNLYPATSLKLLSISTSFLVDSLGFFKETIISSAERQLGLLIAFFNTFDVFSSLIPTVSVSSSMLNNRGDNEHPCFTPDLIGNASNLSPLQMMLVDDLRYILFIIFRKGLSIPILSSVFNRNGCCIL